MSEEIKVDDQNWSWRLIYAVGLDVYLFSYSILSLQQAGSWEKNNQRRIREREGKVAAGIFHVQVFASHSNYELYVAYSSAFN